MPEIAQLALFRSTSQYVMLLVLDLLFMFLPPVYIRFREVTTITGALSGFCYLNHHALNDFPLCYLKHEVQVRPGIARSLHLRTGEPEP